MLNFGYWTKNSDDPVYAQHQLSTLFGKFAKFDTVRMIADVGSGFSAPAVQWRLQYPHLRIMCVDINYQELNIARKATIPYTLNSLPDRISLVNASSAMLPFGKEKLDMIVAFESAQHFKSIDNFLEVSRFVLKHHGSLVLAIPVVDPSTLEKNGNKKENTMKKKKIRLMRKLGILYFSWASQHYDIKMIFESLTEHSYRIEEFQQIGRDVYEPLAEYYFRNREKIRYRVIQQLKSHKQRILFEIVEYMVYRSALKMKDLSVKGLLDYVLVRARKEG